MADSKYCSFRYPFLPEQRGPITRSFSCGVLPRHEQKYFMANQGEWLLMRNVRAVPLAAYFNGINPWLQGQMAKLTTVVLSAIGYNVQVAGNVVYGLTTTVHVTKACVGTEVFATSFVLCAFLSTLFIKPGNQLHTSIRLFGLIFALNVMSYRNYPSRPPSGRLVIHCDA